MMAHPSIVSPASMCFLFSTASFKRIMKFVFIEITDHDGSTRMFICILINTVETCFIHCGRCNTLENCGHSRAKD